MLFDWNNSHHNPEEAIDVIKNGIGIIPVDIDLENKRLIWMNIGDYHFSESFFFVSIEKLLKIRIYSFASDLSVLDSDITIVDSIYPSGFIFHIGRCGSTLLSKALARSHDNLVISEAPPHFLIWSIWNEDWVKPFIYNEEIIRRYKNLILSIGRKRRSSYKAHFIKFTTFNILYLDFIREVFPDVPIIFIYRDPAEVMVAYAEQGPGWQNLKDTAFGAFVAGCSLNEVKTMSDQMFHEHFLYQFMSASLEATPDRLTFINYKQLTPDNLGLILKVLNYSPNIDDIEPMKEQFKYYAKIDDRRVRFTSDIATKRQKITPAIEKLVGLRLFKLYEQLEEAENNISKSNSSSRTLLVNQ